MAVGISLGFIPGRRGRGKARQAFRRPRWTRDSPRPEFGCPDAHEPPTVGQDGNVDLEVAERRARRDRLRQRTLEQGIAGAAAAAFLDASIEARRRRSCAFCVHSSATTAQQTEQPADREQDQEYETQDLRNPYGTRRDSSKTEDRSHNGNQKKNERVVQDGPPPFVTWTSKAQARRVTPGRRSPGRRAPERLPIAEAYSMTALSSPPATVMKAERYSQVRRITTPPSEP